MSWAGANLLPAIAGVLTGWRGTVRALDPQKLARMLELGGSPDEAKHVAKMKDGPDFRGMIQQAINFSREGDQQDWEREERSMTVRTKIQEFVRNHKPLQEAVAVLPVLTGATKLNTTLNKLSELWLASMKPGQPRSEEERDIAKVSQRMVNTDLLQRLQKNLAGARESLADTREAVSEVSALIEVALNTKTDWERSDPDVGPEGPNAREEAGLVSQLLEQEQELQDLLNPLLEMLGLRPFAKPRR